MNQRFEEWPDVEVLTQMAESPQRHEAKCLGGDDSDQRHRKVQVQITGGGPDPGNNFVAQIAEQEDTPQRLAVGQETQKWLATEVGSRGAIDGTDGVYAGDDIQHVGDQDKEEKSSNQWEKLFPLDLTRDPFD